LDKRIGRQTPTNRFCEHYENTKGNEALNLYRKTGREPLPWQENVINDIMALNDDNLWTHMKFGYSLPRRNGKNEVITIRELFGLQDGEQILHTAHRTTTSHTAWERLVSMLTHAGFIEGEDFKTHKQFGLERIEMKNGSGGRISFRTRSSKGGLGEGFDLLVIDEAQEYTDDQQSALKYVVSDSPNPQTLLCGTPPTAVSAGTVFEHMRADCMLGVSQDSGWEEWGVEKMSDPNDRELWYETNPSLGFHLTERKINAEIGADEIDFNIQRLGLWLKYNQKSAISDKEWKQLLVTELPQFEGQLHVGIKYSHESTNVAMGIAVKTEDDRVFVEVIDCKSARQGNGWIIDFLRKADVANVVVDGQSGQHILNQELHDFRMKKGYLPRVDEIVSANALFERAIERQTICHKGQPSLSQVVGNCEKRRIGTKGGYGFKAINDDMEIALMDCVILAQWSCLTAKPKKRQRVSY
jgi:phage terminase large subunit-like protein